MSSESLAAFRKNASTDLRKLSEEHLQHDLQQSDRDTLESAAKKVSTHATIGSAIGIGLGLFLAIRIRTARKTMFQAFRATEKPKAVQFADGRTEAIPDLTPLLQPTTFGDIATYTFFSAGGLFLGGETGFLTGSASAARMITSDPESKKRIESAFRKYRIDVLKKEIDQLQAQDKGSDSGWRIFNQGEN
ncbi:uncharacterized protein BDZ99DRAFT_32680 [Mytilinidion resinicola]|uniref:Uncharacterized protein n=1 Tax=Mytilinidion resinicola TaxID=574789 RepID=A0A6A6YLF2_9PEZI|nr:uncharacterized protein BDZ99DRAFT_32680 [Mytilinidion resinicola]KAF2809611.1 hypothetical protein BDZ99DRAFT_32680 [Mytilinidion resinicola]